MSYEKVRKLAWSVDIEVGNAGIISQIAGHKRQAVMESGCSNEDIKVTDNLARPSQFSSDASKLSHDGRFQGKERSRTEKQAKHRLCLFCVTSVINPLIDFPKGDEAYG